VPRNRNRRRLHIIWSVCLFRGLRYGEPLGRPPAGCLL